MLTSPDNAIRPSLLGLDWGKNRVAAYLLDDNGQTLKIRTALYGVQRIAIAHFRETLQQLCGDWLDAYPEIPIIGCNMLSSTEGLRLVDYASTPIGPANLANRAVRIDACLGRPFAIVPGISDCPLGRTPDLNRGLEAIILGAQDALSVEQGTFILPGTHSKWVKVRNGAIDALRTYMTGELFSILRDHSLLGAMIPTEQPFSMHGFRQGLVNARTGHGELSHLIFSVRALAVTQKMQPDDLLGYLSGILIGDEVLDGLRWAGADNLYLIGSDHLTPLYQKALDDSHRNAIVASRDVAARGLYLLAREIRW